MEEQTETNEVVSAQSPQALIRDYYESVSGIHNKLTQCPTQKRGSLWSFAPRYRQITMPAPHHLFYAKSSLTNLA